ncbi:sensor histidine kinase [Flavobacterium litorale]|uniref:histidine kinase n=1 Tax=Flavobacterium litorale TaxID=2856519 RepID=A0ABX8VAD5_9FLAO|nr:ATP-binding protein [Flavobacterium litorale]QYJ67629.1 PAS domain S-box protein [Flavobacterium litorale]
MKKLLSGERIKLSNFLSLIVLLVTSLVILGWFLHVPLLKSVKPDYISMKFNTALCFILTTISILISLNKPRYFKDFAVLLHIIVFTIAAVSYSQELFSFNAGLDEFFILDREATAAREKYPGRMSPITAILFCIMAVALSIERYAKKYKLIAQYLFHFVTLVAFIGVIGYIFNAPQFYTFSFVTSMAIHTASSFLIISLAASLINPNLGINGIFHGKSTSKKVAKRLFVQISASIIFFTYIRYLLSYKYKYIDNEFSIVALVICFVLISLFIIRQATTIIENEDKERRIAEEYFKLVVESAPNALLMYDNTGTIKLVNVQAEKMFGYNREIFEDKKIQLFLPELLTNAEMLIILKDKGSLKNINIRSDSFGIKKDGTKFPVEFALNPIRQGDGVMMILASVMDITERKKQETIISQQVIELQLKNQEMEQFNYIASHDLQEPLRTVANYIMLLEEDYNDELSDDVKVHLKTMNSAITRMNLLVRSLLDFARLGRDKKLILVNTGTIVNEVITDLGNLIKNANATITMDNELPMFSGYETELRQLFQNLINNAIKFRKKDCPVKINIGHNQYGELHEFYVKDNGIGIESRYNKRIFDIFKTLNKNTDFEGHGIGLANCRKIVEMHGGKIWVESIVGEGSTFKFTIRNNFYNSKIKQK